MFMQLTAAGIADENTEGERDDNRKYLQYVCHAVTVITRIITVASLLLLLLLLYNKKNAPIGTY